MCTLLMVSIKRKRPACILSVLFPLEKCIKRPPLLMKYPISDIAARVHRDLSPCGTKKSLGKRSDMELRNEQDCIKCWT